MNNTKIEWCDGTWNPVTGCLNGCEYCYARKIAHRFGENDPKETKSLTVLESRPENLYPFGFEPTYHRYRLKELLEVKKPQNVFVCSMADLFGNWVPDQWIQEVFAICNMAKRNNYLFLTKNPERYLKVTQYPMDFKENMWFGTTITNNADMDERGEQLYFFKMRTGGKIFLSLEPLHEEINLKRLDNLRHVDWVIIGAESGNRKGKVIPEKEWIMNIVEICNRYGIPVFMKDSLVKIVGEETMLREFPERLKRHSK